MKHVQRNISPSICAFLPPDRGRRPGSKSSPARRQRSTQTAIFRAAAQPLTFVIIVAGLFIELHARLAPPPPPPPPPGIGATATVHGAQRVLLWAEACRPAM
jgi:hypothetical protein